MFREENVALMQEDRRLEQEFNKIVGAQEAEFRGQVLHAAAIAAFYGGAGSRDAREGVDGALEREAGGRCRRWTIFTRGCYEVRQKIACNARYENFRDYKFQDMKRFDYTPQECVAFHDAIADIRYADGGAGLGARAEQMGMEALRPWDTEVVPAGAPPLKPFATAQELEEGCYRIVKRIDPELAGLLQGDD